MAFHSPEISHEILDAWLLLGKEWVWPRWVSILTAALGAECGWPASALLPDRQAHPAWQVSGPHALSGRPLCSPSHGPVDTLVLWVETQRLREALRPGLRVCREARCCAHCHPASAWTGFQFHLCRSPAPRSSITFQSKTGEGTTPSNLTELLWRQKKKVQGS